jgi:hypothetical protein
VVEGQGGDGVSEKKKIYRGNTRGAFLCKPKMEEVNRGEQEYLMRNVWDADRLTKTQERGRAS